MSIKENEEKLALLKKELEVAIDEKNQDLQKQLNEAIRDHLNTAYKNIANIDKVAMARNKDRPNINEYIEHIFDQFIELHGDRSMGDDRSIVGGIAFFKEQPVTVIGHQKGRSIQENAICNYGMSNPSGYRKALRLMKQAEKFNRPIINFVDTPGAYPGMEAEQYGIGEAIARNLMEMATLTVPIITIITGEGGSGGALALAVANRVVMLENSVYSILSPEGFASILWKDSSKADVAADVMKLDANNLKAMGIIDDIIDEPAGGVDKNPSFVYTRISLYLNHALKELTKLSSNQLVNKRYEKYRAFGSDVDV